MMIRLALLLPLLFACVVSAETITSENEPVEAPAPKVIVKLGVGLQARIEKIPGSSGEQTESLSVPSVFAQLDYKQYQLHTEFQQMSTSSGEGDYHIETKRHELLTIARYRFMLNEKWAVYGGLGGGLGRETIKSSIAGSSVTKSGDMEKVGVLDSGLQIQFGKRFLSEFGVRGLKLENFEPWIIAFGLRLGVQL